MSTKIDTERIKEQNNLLEIVEQALGPGNRSGHSVKFICPFHDELGPSLTVYDDGRWHCFGCRAEGDVIAFVMEYYELSFHNACDRLSNGIIPTMGSDAPRKPKPKPEPYNHPPENWQKQARVALEQCQRLLFQPTGKLALDYLMNRGLHPKTIKRYQLGYSPGRKYKGLYIPQGVVIPLIADGAIWSFKIRLLPGYKIKCSSCRLVLPGAGICPNCGEKNKYRGVMGNKPKALFGADNLKGKKDAVMVEGEFDAMLLDQVAGNLVGVVSLGSAGTDLDVVRWFEYLLPIERIYLAYDSDTAGAKGAAAIEEITKRARRLRVPHGKGGNDLTDFYLSGGRLRDWLTWEMEIAEYQYRSE